MMVEHRVNNNEREDDNLYEVNDDERINNTPLEFDADANAVDQRNATIQINRRLERTFYRGTALNLEGMRMEELEKYITRHEQICNERWKSLYDRKGYYALQDAIIEQLIKYNDNKNE